MVNYQDPAAYKKCQKKLYDIFVCMPEKDTVVISKLEQADVVKALGGKTFFSPADLMNIKARNPHAFDVINAAVNQGRAYVVSDKTPFVLAGTLGELWCIDSEQLAQKYIFTTGDRINDQTLKKRLKNGVLDWTSIRTVQDNSKAWACFVPVSQKGQVQTAWKAVLTFNGKGVSHGKGDFIIAQDMGDRPNLNDIYVVNGNVFATTYNNTGWGDCIDSRATKGNIKVDKLPKIKVPDSAKKEESSEDLTEVFSALVKNIMLVFQSEGFNVSMEGTSEEDVANYRARMRIGESDKGKQSTVFFSVDNKTGKFNVKCKRDGKVFDEAYKISKENKGKLGVIFLCVYLDFCSLFKMTPFRFATRPRFITSAAKNVLGYANYNMHVKVDTRSFETDFAENCSASVRFKFSAVYTGDKPIFGKMFAINNCNAEIRVRLNKSKLKSLIVEAKKTGNIDPDLSKQSFSIKLNVAHAPVQEIDLDDLLVCFGACLISGVKDEKKRQKESNERTKGNKLYASRKEVAQEYMKKDKHKMDIYKSMPKPISHYQDRFKDNAKALKKVDDLKKGVFNVGSDLDPMVLYGYALNKNNFIGYVFMFKDKTSEIQSCDFRYGAGGYCVPMSEQYNDEILEDALYRCMDAYDKVH